MEHAMIPRTSRRTRTMLLALLATTGTTLASFGALASTQKPAPVVISAVHGEVQVLSLGSPVRVAVGAVLNLPASVRTGAESSIELRQGETIVSAAANAQLEIPVSADPAERLDRIIQSRGNVYYSVAKRTTSKLNVETRYLVAVIKGTRFNVSATESSATLSLLEGLIELRDASGTDMIELTSGQIGSMSADQPRIRVLSMTSGETLRAGRVAPVDDGSGAQNSSPAASDSSAPQGATQSTSAVAGISNGSSFSKGIAQSAGQGAVIGGSSRGSQGGSNGLLASNVSADALVAATRLAH
ncbi:MAG: FecR domain-containing protein [Proteobacteria bacterium]|nr:FecR domain-containing protein [Pseudomonadota bacterium]